MKFSILSALTLALFAVALCRAEGTTADHGAAPEPSAEPSPKAAEAKASPAPDTKHEGSGHHEGPHAEPEAEPEPDSSTHGKPEEASAEPEPEPEHEAAEGDIKPEHQQVVEKPGAASASTLGENGCGSVVTSLALVFAAVAAVMSA
ncbi:protein TsetseEP [Hyalella azteca]|uniref:Protein TsetseEP n=1 Tax=Hyalella azteca TaxID=294128 RepID=A0A8B7N5P6_HYAAZ|nr:protein TsetseEP [Hyalella azteca]